MLKINNEKIVINKIDINKYKLTHNKKIVDDVYVINIINDEKNWLKYYNTKPLEFYNNFELNKKVLINEYIDQNGVEISYNGLYAEEFAFDNEFYLTKIDDYIFELEIFMDTFIFNHHHIKTLELKEIIDFNKQANK